MICAIFKPRKQDRIRKDCGLSWKLFSKSFKILMLPRKYIHDVIKFVKRN